MQLFEVFRSIVFLIIILVFCMMFLKIKENDKRIFGIMLIILFCRLIYSIIFYWFNLPPDMPDIHFYESQISTFISTSMDIRYVHNRFDVRNYVIFQSIARILIGNVWYTTVAINSILGTLSIYNAGKIGYEIAGNRAKLLAIVFLTFEPTIFIYTNTHLREAIVLYTITLAILQLIKYIKYQNNKNIILFIIITSISGLFRTVNLFVLMVMGIISIVLTKGKIKFNMKKLVIILVSIIALGMIINLLSNKLNFSIDIKYINENLNRDLLSGGNMTYLVGERYDSWIHLIISIPKRLLYFMLYPFPWEPRYISHIVPFTSSCYNLLFILIILILFLRYKSNIENKRFIKKIIIVMITGLIIYAVVKCESASRHRLQFIWMIPVITSSIIAGIDKNKNYFNMNRIS